MNIHGLTLRDFAVDEIDASSNVMCGHVAVVDGGEMALLNAERLIQLCPTVPLFAHVYDSFYALPTQLPYMPG
jgi:hypothetical protein